MYNRLYGSHTGGLTAKIRCSAAPNAIHENKFGSNGKDDYASGDLLEDFLVQAVVKPL